MKTKKFKPITPSLRTMTVTDFTSLTAKKPYKKLTKKLKSNAGRDNLGHVSVRHRGGGVKKKYRLIDFKRFTFNTPAKVLTIEYDPYRSAFIALIEYQDQKKTKSYILAPYQLKVGEMVESGSEISAKIGNHLLLKNIPLGTEIHNIELQPKGGGKIVRSAGQYAILSTKDKQYVNVKLPSGEIRRFHENCFATVGRLSNLQHANVVIGKAGRKRLMGIRPTVRGKAMHPAAHPHGGGEGRNPIGLKYPKTPWGKIAIGGKTRKKKKSNKFIIKRRK